MVTQLFGLVLASHILGCHSKMKGDAVGGASHAVYVHCAAERWFCGGTLLNQRMVLTAGHCFSNIKPSSTVLVEAGHDNLDKATVTRKVVSFTRHENYEDRKLEADIALLLLSDDFILSDRIRRVIITPSFPQGVIHGQVVGWGYEKTRQNKTSMLKMVQQKIRVWPTQKCKKYTKMLPGTICGSSDKTTGYPFIGDSGSALMTDDGQAIGLMSYRANASKLKLSVFTNVSYYYDWIEDRAEKLCSCQSYQ